MGVSTYSWRLPPSSMGWRASTPPATSFFSRVVSRWREICRRSWKSSKRVTPPKASRRISRLPHSPTRSTARAIGQSASAHTVRCMAPRPLFVTRRVISSWPRRPSPVDGYDGRDPRRTEPMPIQALARRGPRAPLLLAGLLAAAGPAAASSILFIGNSFTYAQGSPVHYYRANTVTDLNGQGIGGMPALFKSFTTEAGLSYDVYLETQGGVGIDWHLEHKSAVVGQRAWDSVVMHGYSTLDAARPGDPALLVDTVRRMSALLRAKNPAVEIRLMSTWPRADQTYDSRGAWYGKPLETMARDLRAGYEKAAAATPGPK